MADVNDLIRDLKKIQKNSQNAAKKTNMKIIADAKDMVVDKTPVDTGALQGDWNIEVDDLIGLLFNDMEYAANVEFGHRVSRKGGGGKKRRKGNKDKVVRQGRKDGKATGSPVEGVYMLRDTMNAIKSNMDYYSSYYIKELGLEDD